MKNYAADRKTHLSDYKITNLTTGKGKWRDDDYEHILPLDQSEKNIIEPFRDDFWKYFKGKGITLHQYFHHLNSSQALCFNLFFPLFYYDTRFITYVLERIIEVPPYSRRSIKDIKKILSIADDKESERYAKELDEKDIVKNRIVNCEFETILSSAESTNFDFFVQQQKEHRVLFEIKYTENGFGKAEKDARHQLKYKTIYQPKLKGILRAKFITEDFVFDNYQLVRNLSYIDNLTSVVFVFPEDNPSFKDTRNLISEILLPNKRKQVRIICLEHLIRQILTSDYLIQFRPAFEIFKQKYLD